MLAVNETNSCTVVKCLNIRIGKSASIWLLAKVWILSAEDGRLGWLEIWGFEGSADRRRPAWRMVGEAKKPELGLSSVKVASPPIWAPLIFFSCHIRTDRQTFSATQPWMLEGWVLQKKSLLQATDHRSATNTWNQLHLIQEIFPGRLGTPPSVGGRQGARNQPEKILIKTWSEQSVTWKWFKTLAYTLLENGLPTLMFSTTFFRHPLNTSNISSWD